MLSVPDYISCWALLLAKPTGSLLTSFSESEIVTNLLIQSSFRETNKQTKETKHSRCSRKTNHLYLGQQVQTVEKKNAKKKKKTGILPKNSPSKKTVLWMHKWGYLCISLVKLDACSASSNLWSKQKPRLTEKLLQVKWAKIKLTEYKCQFFLLRLQYRGTNIQVNVLHSKQDMLFRFFKNTLEMIPSLFICWDLHAFCMNFNFPHLQLYKTCTQIHTWVRLVHSQTCRIWKNQLMLTLQGCVLKWHLIQEYKLPRLPWITLV